MQHFLYEHSKGYLLFEMKEFEDLSKGSYQEYMKLTQVVNLIGRYDFSDVQLATNNIQILCNNKIPEELQNFLELNDVKILHCDGSLKHALKEINIKQKTSLNIYRGIKYNEHRFLKQECDMQFVLGISHSFSRNKVEYNSKKEDNILIHSVNMLEQLEKDINSYSMRIKELYGWSFPELFNVCVNNDEYIKAVSFFTAKSFNNTILNVDTLSNKEDGTISDFNIKDKIDFDEKTDTATITNERLNCFYKLKNSSIGVKINEIDLINIRNLCDIIKEKIEIKNKLKNYMKVKMSLIAPNLTELLGDMMAAKLIVLCGGLCNLAKTTSSTIQLLGAEKSLFQALKSRSDTPKYGVLFYSNLVGKTQMKNKAKFCRFLASKIFLLSKIDCFSVTKSNAYGLAVKKLVNKKIKSFDTNKEIETTDAILSRVYNKLKEC